VGSVAIPVWLLSIVVVAEVVTLTESDWMTLRDVRLRALTDSPECFAATLTEESGFDEAAWRLHARDDDWCVATAAGTPIGIMGVASVQRHECDCWLHGCWVDPRFRKQGVTRRMVAWLDDLSRRRGWLRQGLGVWPENSDAIAAWERLGYIATGTPLPSSRRPGQLHLVMRRGVPAAAPVAPRND
jgi:GNAT superfamily N-acetyltransferase